MGSRHDYCKIPNGNLELRTRFMLSIEHESKDLRLDMWLFAGSTVSSLC
jgi:hypothetical protein